jgi:ribosomal protein S28E/S33
MPRMAVHWHPTVGPTQVGDTMLVSETGFELVTPPTDWPALSVTVKGKPVRLADILVRASRTAQSTSVVGPAQSPNT